MKKFLLVSLMFLFCVTSFSKGGNSPDKSKSKKQEIVTAISSTKWILSNPDGPVSMIEFAKNGIYKCFFGLLYLA